MLRVPLCFIIIPIHLPGASSYPPNPYLHDTHMLSFLHFPRHFFEYEVPYLSHVSYVPLDKQLICASSVELA